MKTLHYCFIFVLIVPTLIIFLVGCGIDVGPGAYTEDDVYYEGSVYDPYYDAGSPRAYDYDPSYDPWTIGTYYQYYIDASAADTSSGSSNTGGARIESKRSFATAGDFTPVHQSRAPGNERASVRRDRSAIRERKKTDSESSSSSITRQKVRRDVSKEEQTQTKSRRKQVRSSKAGQEDEEKK